MKKNIFLEANEAYVSPQVEVIEMEIEGTILSGSSVLDDIEDGGSAW